MRILIAEDDPVSRRILVAALAGWGYEVVATCDGDEALQALLADGAPKLAILDWMMPGRDGPEVCREVRDRPTSEPPYLLLLTTRDAKRDIVAGLEAGADDYLTKPFDRAELCARLDVARRVLGLQRKLAARVVELEEALAQVKRLRGLLPICSYCKKVRDDGDYWQQVDAYLAEHAGVEFTHGICPACLEREMAALAELRSPLAGGDSV